MIMKKLEKLISNLDEAYFRNTKYTFSQELNTLLSTEKLIEIGYNVGNRQFSFNRYNNFDTFKSVFTASHEQVVSWSDDDRQPKIGDILFGLKFSCGAYIFGNSFDGDYPKDFFKGFWDELKGFNPDYVDSVNSSMFWNIENGADIFNAFDEIYAKYRKLNEIDYKKRVIEKKRAEIEKLESQIK